MSRRIESSTNPPLYGADEVTMMDVAVDGGSVEHNLEKRQIIFRFGPVVSHYMSLPTLFERMIFRGLMEGFGIMRPRQSVGPFDEEASP